MLLLLDLCHKRKLFIYVLRDAEVLRSFARAGPQDSFSCSNFHELLAGT